VVSAGGGRRRKPEEATPGEPAAAEVPEGTDEDVAAKPLLGEADPELERLLQEEEDINRRIRQQHETPHFRGDDE
jgi:small subunit ribosomal protein S3